MDHLRDHRLAREILCGVLLTTLLLFIDVIGLASLSGMASPVTFESAIRALIYLPALMARMWMGHHCFKGVDKGKFRKVVQLSLAVMGLLIGANALAQPM